MTTVDVVSDDFAPAPLARVPVPAQVRSAVARRQRLARLASAPAVTLLVLGTIAAIAHWVPELGLPILVPDVLRSFAPAVPRAVFTGGAPLVPDLPPLDAPATIAFVAALALGLAARQGGWARWFVAPAAALLAAASGLLAAGLLASAAAHLLALLAAAAATVIGVTVAWIAVQGHLRGGPHPFARRTPGLSGWRTAWLVAYLAVPFVPFVVGRALVGAEWRDRAAEIAQSGSSAFLSPLFSWALPLGWLLGAAVGVAVWAALRLVPPTSETHPAPAHPAGSLPPIPVPAIHASTGPAAVLTGTVTRRPARVAPAVVAVVLLALGVGVVAPAAAGEAGKTVATTRSEVPFQSDARCPVFTLPGSTPPKALVPGRGCAGLESYAAYERTGVSTAHDAFAVAEGALTTDLEPITGSVAAAVYDPVLVIAGSTTGEALDVVSAHSFDDAATVWWFQCPDAGPLSVRFAGSGADDPAAARSTHPDEGETVFVGCLDGSVRALDPRTGAPR